MVKFPPKGYTTRQYPLPHNFSYYGQLLAEGPTKDSTILPILSTTEAVSQPPDLCEVNPRNSNFAEETGARIYNGSIVPKIGLSMTLALSKLAIETDGVRTIKVNWMPIYISFESSLNAADAKTAVQIEDILELQHDTTNKDTYPLNVAAAKVTRGSSHPLSTVVDSNEALGDWGLTSTAILEHVAFDKELFFDALSYYTNGAMLRKVTGKMRTITLTRDHHYNYYSNNFTYPSVKRGNEYTFCGILLHLPQVDSADQRLFAADVTAIGHVDFFMNVRYDEWNPLFDQAP